MISGVSQDPGGGVSVELHRVGSGSLSRCPLGSQGDACRWLLGDPNAPMVVRCCTQMTFSAIIIGVEAQESDAGAP